MSDQPPRRDQAQRLRPIGGGTHSPDEASGTHDHAPPTASARPLRLRAGQPWRTSEKIAAVIGILVSVVLTAVLIMTAIPEPRPSPQPETPTATGRGDPAMAQRLADQAAALASGDPLGQIRLLLAAHVVDPDSATHRAALAEALLGGSVERAVDALAPGPLMQSRLDTSEPISYAVASTDGSYLLTSGHTDTHLWQARLPTGDWRVRLVERIDAPVTVGAGAGDVLTNRFVFTQGDEVWRWTITNPRIARPAGPMGGRADAVAITTDAQVSVVVEGTAGTIWQVGGLRPEARGALVYRQAVTALAFAPESLTLAAGHGDGSVTLHTIDLQSERADERVLTSTNGSVDAVAAATDGSTAFAVHANGAVSVWDLRLDGAEPAGSAAAAVGAGPHRAWLSPTGGFAVVADAAGNVILVSLKDRARPRPLHTLVQRSGVATPAMITSDGRVAMTIDQDKTLTVWNLAPLQNVIENPTELACRITRVNHDEWRRMVPNDAYGNPCQPPPLPTFNDGSGTPPSPEGK